MSSLWWKYFQLNFCMVKLNKSISVFVCVVSMFQFKEKNYWGRIFFVYKIHNLICKTFHSSLPQKCLSFFFIFQLSSFAINWVCFTLFHYNSPLRSTIIVDFLHNCTAYIFYVWINFGWFFKSYYLPMNIVVGLFFL